MSDDARNAPWPENREAPTLARFKVLAFLGSLALLLYIDRVCIGLAKIYIVRDLGLTNDQMSYVFNAFTLAYTLFEVPTGHWGDRYGSRGVITRIVIWWSVFTALTGAAGGLISLIVIRFLFGVGEAGAFPNAALVVTKWFPLHEQGRVRGVITTVSFAGAALAPVLFSYFNDLVGWRYTFGIFGAFGIVWAAVFYWWFRDDPALHPAANDAEVRIIHGNRIPEKPDDHNAHAIPWGIVLRSPNVWLLGLLMTIGATLFYTQFQWYSSFLDEVYELKPEKSSWLTSVIMVGGGAGCLFGGVLADLAIRLTGERKWSRRLCGGGALFASGLSLVCMRFMSTPLETAICNAFALFFLQVSIPTWWTVVAEISGRHGASMWGLMNSMGGLGVMVSTKLIGGFLTLHQKEAPLVRWTPVFDGVALLLFFGGFCWLAVDATKSIVGDDEDRDDDIPEDGQS